MAAGTRSSWAGTHIYLNEGKQGSEINMTVEFHSGCGSAASSPATREDVSALIRFSLYGKAVAKSPRITVI